jgi:hypothetical protein
MIVLGRPSAFSYITKNDVSRPFGISPSNLFTTLVMHLGFSQSWLFKSQ